jgi:hypothetical protein
MDNNSNDHKKRVVTSAINGMTVGDARRCLDYMRKQWANANSNPFFITNTLPQENMAIQTFALLFIKGQHHKRHNKGAVDHAKK